MKQDLQEIYFKGCTSGKVIATTKLQTQGKKNLREIAALYNVTGLKIDDITEEQALKILKEIYKLIFPGENKEVDETAVKDKLSPLTKEQEDTVPVSQLKKNKQMENFEKLAAFRRGVQRVKLKLKEEAEKENLKVSKIRNYNRNLL